MTSKRNFHSKAYGVSGKVDLIHIQGLTPKFPRSFVSDEQINNRRLK